MYSYLNKSGFSEWLKFLFGWKYFLGFQTVDLSDF